MTGSWSLDRQTVLHCRIVANGAGRRDLAGSCTSIASVSCQVPHLRTEPHGYNGRIDINILLALKELCPSDASAHSFSSRSRRMLFQDALHHRRREMNS